jgi:hypothetical protein
MKKAAVAALWLLVLALAAPALRATTVVALSEEEMIQQADLILTGRCTRLESTWIDRQLVTLATVSVSAVLKGQPGSEITVVVPGGIDVNRKVPVAMTFAGAPKMFVGEDVLLFLTPEGRVTNGWMVAGFSQGKYTIVDSPQGKAAKQDLTGLQFEGRARGGARSLDLQDLRQKVERSLAEEMR